MTDFYQNPPNTKQDVRLYLTSWLAKVDDASPLEIGDEVFIQELGFRRAFHSHCVFRNISTDEYVWWVFEEFDLTKFPKTRFATYESLLENVIDEYVVAWKLSE